NIAAVQFDHRALAVVTVSAVFLLWAAGLRANLPISARRALHVLLAVAVLQAALGISTLLLVVPIPLAAAHQAGAVLLLTVAIVFRYALRYAGRNWTPSRAQPYNSPGALARAAWRSRWPKKPSQ